MFLYLADTCSFPDSLERNWAEMIPFLSLTEAHLSSTVMTTKLSFSILRLGVDFLKKQIKIVSNQDKFLLTLSTVR